MAGLRVFVSSTCYDLSVIRSQLRIFIQNLGHEPLMSDYSDLLYDPRIHTHTSCVDEVASADVVVLIVGARFGGKTVPEALAKLDFDLIKKESSSTKTLSKKENLSVTQLEILKAVESGIPVFTFVDAAVWHDHALYEKNKDKPIISDISFPSIEKPETASFIFEFINFLRHRTKGNSVHTFSKLKDIEDILRKQWSSLFQKLIQEQRGRAFEARRLDNLTEQFEDLKTAILTTIGTSNEREVARGVVRFRRLIDFIRTLGIENNTVLIKGKISWDELIKQAGIEQIIDTADLPEAINYRRRNLGPRIRLFLVKKDQTFFELRTSLDFYNSLSIEWEAFIGLSNDTREIIVDALSEMRPGMGPLRYVREPFLNFFNNWLNQESLLKNINEDLDDDNI